jgi:ubiquinone/menaquinone biosynthesis C-methylase UbiE
MDPIQQRNPSVGGSQSYLLTNDEIRAREERRLRFQAEALFPIELTHLRHAGLQDQVRILELGCGTGEFLAQIRDAFPRAHLLGMDRNELLLEKARERLPHGAWFCGNLHDTAALENLFATFQPDFILVRYVLQHMNREDARSVLQSVRKLKPRGCRVIAIDAADSEVRFEPACPALESLSRKKIELQQSRGGDRTIGSQLASLFEEAGFDSVREQKVVFDTGRIGWSAFEAVFLPIFLSALGESPSAEELLLKQSAEHWFQTERAHPSALAAFTTYHVDGI